MPRKRINNNAGNGKTMEPQEMVRFFVVRPPEPKAVVNPDRLGRSEFMEKLTGLLVKEKTDNLLKEFQNLEQSVKKPSQSVLLKFVQEHIFEDAVKSAESKHESAQEQTNTKKKQAQKKALEQTLQEPESKEKREQKMALEQTLQEPELLKLSPEALQKELTQLRDRWMLQRIMESRFVLDLKKKSKPGTDGDANCHLTDDKPIASVETLYIDPEYRSPEDKKNIYTSDASVTALPVDAGGDEKSEFAGYDDVALLSSKKPTSQEENSQIELALKIGTALLLRALKPSISKGKLEAILFSPLATSTRLAQALQLRRAAEINAGDLTKRQDKVSMLVDRRTLLRKLRRIGLDVLEELSELKNGDAVNDTAQKKAAPRTIKSRLTKFLPFWYKVDGTVEKKPARPAIKVEQFIKEINNWLTDEEKNQAKALLAAVPDQWRNVPGFFRKIEDDICAITRQTAATSPERVKIVVRALRAAYSRPQVPMQPVGFIDLMRVTEELVGYAAREIAHIENKAGGETRERIHTLTESNQNILSTEQFEETEETRDLQTTQRNELQSTASQTSEQEFSINSGLNVSASYGVGVGTSVQMDASLEVGYRSAVSTSQQTASAVTRETIAKTVSRLRQNQRHAQTATIVRTTEERNRHEYKVANSRTDTYLWVEKIHELKLKSYGKRLVLEFFVPEPGLPLAMRYSSGSPLGEPEDFQVLPSEINEDNYGELKQKYGAVGISPPPSEYLMIGTGHARKFDSTSQKDYYAYEESLKVPVNYIPNKIFINAQAYAWADIYVAFSGREVYRHRFDWFEIVQSIDDTYVITPDMAEVDQQGDGLSLTVLFTKSLLVGGRGGFYEGNVNVAVLCGRSCRAYQQWQLDTHDRLYAAYRARVAEFEDKRNANPMAGTIGGSAAANREAERDALKRAAFYILKGEPIFHDLFPPSDDGGLPADNFDIAGLQRLRGELEFFEEGFEWKQCTYKLYASHWGNEDRANERKRFQSADPKHSAFLSAGAARVLVPVLPGREREVLEYLAQQFGSAYANLSSDGTLPSAKTIYSDIWNELPVVPDATEPDTWRKSLTESREDLVFGQGTVNVTQTSKSVVLSDVSFDPMLDLGREIWIEARQFFVSKITDMTGKSFELDQQYSGPTNPTAQYLVGARTIGAPWTVRFPTSLVVLREFKDQLQV